MRNSLTVEACKQVVYGLVLSHLDFCHSIYVGLPKIDIKRMQRIQNAAANLVLICNKYESSTEALKRLHWLPIKFRILFKVLTLVHKCLYNQAPSYLPKVLQLNEKSGYSLKSNMDGIVLRVPKTKARTFADRSFSVFAPTNWNLLPREIRQINNLEHYRKSLKTYLFNEAFK